MGFPNQIYQRIDKTKIKKLRTDKGFTLLKMADEIGVSIAGIQKFENKRNHIPSVELIIRYCEYFQVPFIELLIPEEKKAMAKKLADFFLQHEIVDHGTANSIINYYS